MTASALSRPASSRSDAGVGLWVFIGVATALFALFIMAYAMRTTGGDWSSIALPWQLALSTTLLATGSLAMEQAARAARRSNEARARSWLLGGGACAAAFLGAQLWAWAALLDAHVSFQGNPAASFFYLLTAMHGLHVIGGLVAWSVAAHAPRLIVLCARYWHFLLAVWLVLLATLAGVTPTVVGWICGPLGVNR